MIIKNRNLTINQKVANDTAICIAACTVEFNPLEIGALANPFHPGFRLTCVLEAADPGPDPVIFTYPRTKTFRGLLEVFQFDQVFEEELSLDLLNEDVSGFDEIRARFTLVDRSNGRSVTRSSPIVSLSL